MMLGAVDCCDNQIVLQMMDGLCFVVDCGWEDGGFVMRAFGAFLWEFFVFFELDGF